MRKYVGTCGVINYNGNGLIFRAEVRYPRHLAVPAKYWPPESKIPRKVENNEKSLIMHLFINYA